LPDVGSFSEPISSLIALNSSSKPKPQASSGLVGGGVRVSAALRAAKACNSEIKGVASSPSTSLTAYLLNTPFYRQLYKCQKHLFALTISIHN